MKHQIKIYIITLFSAFLGSCTTAKITEGTLQEVRGGRPNQSSENEVQFMLDLRKPTLLSNSISPERNPNIKFSIKAIFDPSNKMFNVKNELPKGKYRVVATSDDTNFKAADATVFLFIINEKQMKITTTLKAAKQRK